ncbi:MAG: hypothetical protein ABL894_12680 [Hyphomicrobium sp.]
MGRCAAQGVVRETSLRSMIVAMGCLEARAAPDAVIEAIELLTDDCASPPGPVALRIALVP